MYDMIICGGQVVTPAGISKLDIGIVEGKIAGLFQATGFHSAKKRVDASGRYVLPGGIDVHVHMDDLGADNLEDWKHGSLAAAAGGITTVVDMPIDNIPSTTNQNTMRQKLERIKGNSYVDYMLWGGLTTDNLSSLTGMLEEGAVGLKAFLVDSGAEDFRRVTDGILMEAMKMAAEYDFPIMVHAESEELNCFYTEKYKTSTDWADWSDMHPEAGELAAVAKCLIFAEAVGARVHIAHISSARTAEIIQEARKRGVKVTCETCPHYLLFTDQDYVEKGELLKCAPPVRGKEDCTALWQAIEKGMIDIISSDHSPGITQESAQYISEMWSGIASIQNTLLALYSEGVCKARLSLERMAQICALNPARLLGIDTRKGSIEVGKDADLVILDPAKDTIFDKKQMKMKMKKSVYENFHFHGGIEHTYLRGMEVKTGIPGGRYIHR